MDEARVHSADLRDDRLESPVRRLLIFSLAIAILAADFWVIDLAGHLRDWFHLPISSDWNWFGKIMSIAFSCVVLACSPWLRRNVGLRWQQAPGSTSLSVGCFVSYLACAIGIGFLMPPIAFSADTLMFQFLIPGIDEELLIRGILLALFERAFGQSPMSCRLRFGYAAMITSLAFGLPHAVSVVDGHYQFSFIQFSTTTAWAAVAALVRTRSGSLLWPIVYHGSWNGSIFLVAMVRQGPFLYCLSYAVIVSA
jgi:membrane protease YdiL (CAAX protease family)